MKRVIKSSKIMGAFGRDVSDNVVKLLRMSPKVSNVKYSASSRVATITFADGRTGRYAIDPDGDAKEMAKEALRL